SISIRRMSPADSRTSGRAPAPPTAGTAPQLLLRMAKSAPLPQRRLSVYSLSSLLYTSGGTAPFRFLARDAVHVNGPIGAWAMNTRALLHRRRLCPSSETVGMRTRRPRPAPAIRSAFAGFRFPPDVIVLVVRWYLRFGLSYRDVEELLAERG